MEWRLLNTGFQDGPVNMAIDEAILLAHAEGKVPPTLRFYGWEPAAVSLGYFQRFEKEIDVQACQGLGIDWVRRLTGGRAVLHDHEVTYSVIISEEHLSGSVLETYKELSQGLLAGFQVLGARAELKAPDSTKVASVKGTSAACFDAPSWYELVVEDRKIVGSAQTRKSGVILQHGSIPLSIDLDRLVGILRVPSEQARARLKAMLSTKAVGIWDVLPDRPDFERVAQAMAEGFAQALEVKLIPGELTPEEQRITAQLRQSKYAGDQWTRRR